jgi:ribosome maturation factor RimP
MSVLAPLLENITRLAQQLADTLMLEVVDVTYKTHTQPPTLRIDIRNREQGTGIDDCANLSRLLEPELDATDWFSDPYMLEISSPGIDRTLTTEQEFATFRGFPVQVTGYAPIRGQKIWEGTLMKRDETTLQINLQGRIVTLPLKEIALVQLCESKN